MTLFDGLNAQQHAAVTAGLGPVLVLAGPGSGKTRVLTYRLAYLLREMNAPPQSIMAVTFTNKAAGEMRHRVQGILGERPIGLQIGTFHAICARLLRREGMRTPYGQNYHIYDGDDQQSVVKQAVAELNLDPKRYTPRSFLAAISNAKNELLTPGDLPAPDYFAELVVRVYTRYQAILLDNNAMDFDDLLMQFVFLLRDDPTVQSKYQNLLQFLLVDEFQDTNTAQYQMVQLLGAPQNNILVVGDEDQGIYAFRGADYRNVLHFRQDYPQAQVILLEHNYRSTQNVLDVARAIIDKNPNRTPKALFTDRAGGDLISIEEAYSEDFEARFVVDKVEELYKRRARSGVNTGIWRDFAVMYRTNAQSRALEEAFIREGIPYRLVGGVGFYKRKEVRDLLAYLRLVDNRNDTISFERIINAPRRGIGKKSITDFQYWVRAECANYDEAFERLITGETGSLSARVARLMSGFAQQLKRWRQLAEAGRLIELMDTIIEDTAFFIYIRTEISKTPEEGIDREENVGELRGLVARAEADGVTLSEFIADQSLVSDVDTLADEADSVTLLTLHAAKGLEFPVVFITGLEEGLLPHSRSLEEPEAMAEERRLLYVGITRAQDQVYLTYAFKRTMWGNTLPSAPSRFLADLPSHLIEGLSPRAAAEAEIQRSMGQANHKTYQQSKEATRWESAQFGGGKTEEAAPANPVQASGRFKGKIIPFPGGESTQFKTNDRVQHSQFGRGTVIESKLKSGVEEVSVIFDKDKSKIVIILAEYLRPS